MAIIVDTREKNISHILKYFDKNNIPHISKKLDFGDYTTQNNNTIIERKSGLNELSQNICQNKDRFFREFERSKGYKMIIMIEDCTWDDIRKHNYRSRLPHWIFEDRLKALQNHFMLQIVFTKKEDAGEFIYKTLLNVTNNNI